VDGTAAGAGAGAGDVGAAGAVADPVADATGAVALADPFDTTAAADGGLSGTDPVAGTAAGTTDLGGAAVAQVGGPPGGWQAALPTDDTTAVDPTGAGDLDDRTWSTDVGNSAVAAGDDPLGEAPIERAASGDDAGYQPGDDAAGYEPGDDMAGPTQFDASYADAPAPAGPAGPAGLSTDDPTGAAYAEDVGDAGPTDGDVALTSGADMSSGGGFSDDSYSDGSYSDVASSGSSDFDDG
jgi:hypothetical protein